VQWCSSLSHLSFTAPPPRPFPWRRLLLRLRRPPPPRLQCRRGHTGPGT
jgi:hypothetical protein